MTSHVTTGGQTYSFGIETTSTGTALNLRSKEDDIWPAGATSATYRQPTLEVTFTPPTAPPPTEATLLADAKVDSSNPTQNYGTNSKIHIDGSPDVDSYLKFDVSVPSGKYVQQALLSLWATSVLGGSANKSIIVKRVADTSWVETGTGEITWNNRPSMDAAELGHSADVTTKDMYYSIDVTAAIRASGWYSFGLDQDSQQTTALAMEADEDAANHPPKLELTFGDDPVAMAAGDIACRQEVSGSANARTSNLSGGCHAQDTGFIIQNHRPDRVIALGDIQYECAATEGFPSRYDATWGVFKDKTSPAIGNHEYLYKYDTNGNIPPPDTSTNHKCEEAQDLRTPTPDYTRGDNYFDYWDAVATPSPAGSRGTRLAVGGTGGYVYPEGYYALDINRQWRVIVINTNCQGSGGGYPGCNEGQTMWNWLQTQLSNAQAASQCIIVAGHHPRWTASSNPNPDPTLDDLWELMYDKKVDLFLAGHLHGYERFAKLAREPDASDNPLTTPDPRVRQVTVGSGGKNHTADWNATRVSALAEETDDRDRSTVEPYDKATTHGVLKLSLHPASYDLAFVPDTSSGENGQSFDDWVNGVSCNN